MCGRYSLYSSNEIKDKFGIHVEPNYNISPGNKVLIIDEAHERSLNIDFLLGYLWKLKEKRPDLKIILSSATVDATKFSNFLRGAPVFKVSGRTFPVEIEYLNDNLSLIHI